MHSEGALTQICFKLYFFAANWILTALTYKGDWPATALVWCKGSLQPQPRSVDYFWHCPWRGKLYSLEATVPFLPRYYVQYPTWKNQSRKNNIHLVKNEFLKKTEQREYSRMWCGKGRAKILWLNLWMKSGLCARPSSLWNFTGFMFSALLL